jgi:hypothetical protein
MFLIKKGNKIEIYELCRFCRGNRFGGQELCGRLLVKKASEEALS